MWSTGRLGGCAGGGPGGGGGAGVAAAAAAAHLSRGLVQFPPA